MRAGAILFFLLACTVSLQAQTVQLTGRILNEDGKILPYATVTLKHTGDKKPIKATTSSNNGHFKVTVKPHTKYLVTFLYMGYQNKEIPITTDSTKLLSLGDIHLKEASLQLSEVVVKPLVTFSVDEISYNITSDPERGTSNMLQILERVPLIERKPNGEILVGTNSSKNYIVLRNGKEDALLRPRTIPLNELLCRLPAMGFKTIRVINNPPLKYSQYEYVVDIVADETSILVGYVAKVGAELSFTNRSVKPDASLSASINDKLRLSLTGTNSNQYNLKSSQTRTTKTYSTGSLLKDESESNISSNSYGTNLALSYDLTPKQLITVTASYANSSNLQKTERKTTSSTNDVNVQEYATKSKNRTNSSPFSSTITYEPTFSAANRSLSLSYLVSNTPQSIDDQWSINGLMNYPSSAHANKQAESLFMQRAQLYYRDLLSPKLPMTAKVGFQNLSYNQTIRLFNNQDGDLTEDRSQYREMERVDNTLDAGFDLYFLHFKNLRINIRADASYLFNNKQSKIKTDTLDFPISQEGLAFSNSISVAYVLNPIRYDKVGVTYSFWQRLPNVNQLYHFESPTTPDYLKVGNRSINPELFQSFFLLTRYKRYAIPSIRFIFSNNKICKVWRKNEQGQTVESWENSGKYRAITLATGRRVFNFGKVEFDIQPDITYSVSKTANGETSNMLKWGAALSFWGSLSENTLCILESYYYDSWSKGYTGSRNQIPLNLNLSITYTTKRNNNPAWSFNLSSNLLGWKNTHSNFVNSSDYEIRQSSSYNRLPISLSVHYSFGNFKVKPIKISSQKTKFQGYSTGNADEK